MEGAARPLAPGAALEAALAQLGHFGLYQRYVLLLLCLPPAVGAACSLSRVFVEEQVPFRCVVPECEAVGGTEGPRFEAAAARALLPAGEPCRRYAPLPPPLPYPRAHNCSRARYHRARTVRCDALLYQRTDTLYAEFGLACRERRLAAPAVRDAALPLGLLLAGYVADKFGRRKALCVSAGCAGVLGVARGCAPSLGAYLALQFAGAALGHGYPALAYVMVLEMARPSLRASFVSAAGVSGGAGGALVALRARAAGGWRRLLWAAHAPALLLPLYALLLPDSARWLLAAGHHAQLKRHLRRAALCNKVTISEELLEALDGNKTSATERAAAAEGGPWAQLGRSRVLRARLALCGWCWAAAASLRSGLASRPGRPARGAPADLALHMGLEVVASLLLMMALERFGRRRSILTALLASGAACVAPALAAHRGAALALQFGGELSVLFAGSSLRVLTAELFPTRARCSALAGCELAGWLAAVLAARVPLPGAPARALVYGACSATAALAVLAVPETRRAPLPHSARDAELLRAAAAPPAPAAPPALSADA